MNTTFDTWIAKQFAEGLVDIKFAVMPGKGVSVEAIQDELLAAEASIAQFTRPEPRPTSMMPANISEMFNSVTH